MGSLRLRRELTIYLSWPSWCLFSSEVDTHELAGFVIVAPVYRPYFYLHETFLRPPFLLDRLVSFPSK